MPARWRRGSLSGGRRVSGCTERGPCRSRCPWRRALAVGGFKQEGLFSLARWGRDIRTGSSCWRAWRACAVMLSAPDRLPTNHIPPPGLRTDLRAAPRTVRHWPDTGPAQTKHRPSDPLSPVRPRIIFVTTLTLDYTIRVRADRVRAVKNADADNKSSEVPLSRGPGNRRECVR